MESTPLDAHEIYTNATGTALIVKAVDGAGHTVVKMYSFPFVGLPSPHASLSLSENDVRIAVGRDVMVVMTFDATSRQSHCTTYRLHDFSTVGRIRLPMGMRMREIMLLSDDAVYGMNDASSTQSRIWRLSSRQARHINIFGDDSPFTNARITRIAARNRRILLLMANRKCCMIAVNAPLEEVSTVLYPHDHIADFALNDHAFAIALMNGAINVLNSDGVPVYTVEPRPSRTLKLIELFPSNYDLLEINDQGTTIHLPHSAPVSVPTLRGTAPLTHKSMVLSDHQAAIIEREKLHVHALRLPSFAARAHGQWRAETLLCRM